MRDPETGYDDTVCCECKYDDELDAMDSDDCPIHSDPEGKPLPYGVCCTQYEIDGTHDVRCGNY